MIGFLLPIAAVIMMMVCVLVFVMMMTSDEIDLVMVSVKTSEDLMRVPQRQEHHNQEQKHSSVTQACHQRFIHRAD